MSSPVKRSPFRTLAALMAVVLVACGSVVAVTWFQEAKAVGDQAYEYMELFNQVLSIVERDYVEDVDTKELIYGAIRGMLRTLDPHSQFFSAEEYKQMREDISGSFGGLGIQIGVKDQKLTVIAPIEDTPAWTAGIKAGDWITAINGEATGEMNVNEAVSKMRGPVGEAVTISIWREGFELPKDFSIVRAIIEIKSVRDAKLMKGDVGYVRVAVFTENTTKELTAAMDKIKAGTKQGFKGLVIDLRGNPGGPLNQAVEVSDLFLTEGTIVSIRGRNEPRKDEYARAEGTIDDVPMVVLVNQHSASASEIVAGALQDHGRALILGKTTFGKGSVQQLRQLKGGAGIKLTTAYYYTPGERVIQETGITPDVMVDELSPEQKLKLKEMEERDYLREKDLSGHIKKENVSKRAEPLNGATAEAAPPKISDPVPGATPEKKPEPAPGTTADNKSKAEPAGDEAKLPKEVGDDTDDYQLQRALDVLRSFEIFRAALMRKDQVPKPAPAPKSTPAPAPQPANPVAPEPAPGHTATPAP